MKQGWLARDSSARRSEAGDEGEVVEEAQEGGMGFIPNGGHGDSLGRIVWRASGGTKHIQRRGRARATASHDATTTDC